MVRAGLARPLSTGLWTFLPAGWRTHRKIEQIIREELDGIGALEMLAPVIQPAHLWQQTGRYEIEELFRLSDRRGTPLVLAMTHEEAFTFHISKEVRSYRDLPLLLYHIQIKGRDEPRPRAGVLRTREFIMKDSYSFDRGSEGLEHSYQLHASAYQNIFDRCGLDWYSVISDVGMMGGLGAHEFMAPCAAGENEVALSSAGYAANVEIASATPQEVVGLPEPAQAPSAVDTPGATTIEEVAGLLEVPPGALIKAIPFIADNAGPILALVRGDHQLNEIKLQNALGSGIRPAEQQEVGEVFHSLPGFIGPVGIQTPVIADHALGSLSGLIAGANTADQHLRGIEPGRDFSADFADIRRVEPGDRCPSGAPISIEPAIEVGNIFKLGTRYSEPLNATYLDEHGREQPIWMGSYGIGPARILAAAIEQHSDEYGICWPRALAPFDMELVSLAKDGEPEAETAQQLYDQLCDRGMDVLYDDRDASPGQKFADAELLGCPLRLTVGRRSVSEGKVEAQIRQGRESRSLALEAAADQAIELWRSLR
jgi:prolyl-tRNA synthetase